MADDCANCIDDTSGEYDDARRIKNARFDLKPARICFCKEEKDVVAALQCAKDNDLKIRIRAGGHHHEGMCSGGKDVLLLDVSGMDTIKVDWDERIVEVGPGAANGAIYKTLWNAPQGPPLIFPGGGCEDVRVGGFLQGGGWGPVLESARHGLRQRLSPPDRDARRQGVHDRAGR